MDVYSQKLETKDGPRRCDTHACFSAAMVLMLCLCSSSCRADAQALPGERSAVPFVESADYDSLVPVPESVMGHSVGEKAVRHAVLLEYMQALAKASERVTLTEYGETYEGRRLCYLTITSPANHKRLDEIKADNARLSDPRKLKTPGQANQLIDTLPAVAWLNYSIHGDELSSTDAAVYVAYHLTAAKDEASRKLLDQVVIHINPLVNPDGRERYLSYLEQLTGMVSSPDVQSMQHQALWSRGRGNHYLFDLNRDWLTHLHPEVKNLAEAILAWNPHLLVDSHEQGAYQTYLFDPPRDPINIYLSPEVLNWRRRFSTDQAKAFDNFGWSYFTKDWYSEWSPIYTNAWASMQGAIGLLYEQARANAASVKHPSGEEVTYRETVHHHIVSSLANLQTLRMHRREILKDFLSDRQRALGEAEVEDGIFLLPPSEDVSRWKRLVELLGRQGIEVEFAQEPFKAQGIRDIWGNGTDSREFPAGTLVATSRQPRRRMLQTLCKFDPHLPDSFLARERKELETRRDTMLYDVTTWNLPMVFGLESYWATSISDVRLSSEHAASAKDSSNPSRQGGYGYVIDFADSNVYLALVRLFDNACRPRVATKPFEMGGRKYKEGTVLLRGHENPDGLSEMLQKMAVDFELDIHEAGSALVEDGPDLGSGKFQLLAAPRVAIASQWPVRSTSFGSIWYLLDYHLRLRSSPINIQNIGRIDLRKYNVLVLPDSGGLSRVLDESSVRKIKGWIEDGGTLIAIGDSAAFAAGKERGLSSVRLRRDVLDKLDEYKEAVGRERKARDINIDPNQIWGSGAVGQTESKSGAEKSGSNESSASKSKTGVEKLKRTDEWRRIFSPRGTFLTGVVDTEYWLGFGLHERLPVLIQGGNAFMTKHPVATAVRLSDKDGLRLSGLLWPEARQRLADTAYATVEPVGRGQIILFATDPTYRMWLSGLQRLFLNAVLLGPGIGTSQPAPW